MFVVKATIAPDREAAFNEWYDTVRSGEAARVPGCTGMRRYAAVPLESAHAGDEPWQYMVCYEFESEEAMQAFARSDTLRGDDQGL
jgi:heme-degrading monooxygenase HmoA